MSEVSFEPSTEGPFVEMTPSLREFLPAGPGWRESSAFNNAVSPSWGTTVYARPGSTVVYVATSTS